jgi:hypothetical protein
MKIYRIIFFECLIYLSLLPFFLVATYDLIVFYFAPKGGGNALAMIVISVMTYGFACIITVPSIIYILNTLKKRNLEIKRRIKILLGIIVGVVVIPPIYIFTAINT